MSPRVTLDNSALSIVFHNMWDESLWGSCENKDSDSENEGEGDLRLCISDKSSGSEKHNFKKQDYGPNLS